VVDQLEGIWITEPDEVPAGRPLAVKDLFDTAGLRTTYGSAVFRDHVPARTATAVARLEAGGWATVGKTNLHEFAYGITSQNPHYGTVPNPRAPGRIAGGSSGGSAAALAADLAEGALGTDSGGSIRIPAACCGVAGFKPTHGLVPMDGCFPLAPSFDTAGPLGRSVAVCAEMMAALVPGFEPEELGDLGDLRIGVAWVADCESAIGVPVGAAAALAGARPVQVPYAERIAAAFMAEVADVHRDLFAEHAGRYGLNVATKVGRCLAVGDAEVAAARAARERYREHVARLWDEIDLLITPTLARLPPAADVDELALRETFIRFTIPFNATGAPALALPCGEAGNVPVSLQLAGPPGADALVLAAGALLEGAVGRKVAG
jgi:aspartyl-tRNA(Asn)/glutamyl-tRNA(Gln) amidotransferase subunit A